MFLTIFGRLPSLNDYIKANRTNRYVGAKFKSDVENDIAKHINIQLKGISFQRPVFIRFHWYEKNCKRDLDNVASAKKYILDALVKCGVLPNDGWSNIYGFSDHFYIDKGNPRIEVEIL